MLTESCFLYWLLLSICRFTILSKARHSSHKLKVCMLRSFNPPGCVNLWLFTSIWEKIRQKMRRLLHFLMVASWYSMKGNHLSLVSSLILSSLILIWPVQFAWYVLALSPYLVFYIIIQNYPHHHQKKSPFKIKYHSQKFAWNTIL